jgi:hypothetical protein
MDNLQHDLKNKFVICKYISIFTHSENKTVWPLVAMNYF